MTAVLSICCLFATAAPPAQLPWQKLSPASQSVYRNTDDILRFEPVVSVDSVWESFKAEHGMTLVHIPWVDLSVDRTSFQTDGCLALCSFDCDNSTCKDLSVTNMYGQN